MASILTTVREALVGHGPQNDMKEGPVAAQAPEDLRSARERGPLHIDSLASLLRQGSEHLEANREITTIVNKEPLLEPMRRGNLGREALMQEAHAISLRLVELQHEHGWGPGEMATVLGMIKNAAPLALHWIAFCPVIMNQASDEQQERWLNAAVNHEIVGSYLQTELGHGTNVQGLETTATYIPETDEIEIHSPTSTSTKWWAGCVGLTASHAIVQALLIVNGKSYGPHLFMTQIRSIPDGKVRSGVKVGDIGPKVYGGFSQIDNGWCQFNHFRIPRDDMFAKHSKLLKGGEYVKPPHAKMSYGGMVFIRAVMIETAGWSVARAATISLRYTHVRRQFKDPDSSQPGDLERAVISYPSVNRRLLPIMAKAYAYIMTGHRMKDLYDTMAEQLASGNATLLEEVHAASSALKSYCTKETIVAIEEARQALGGHGFSHYSGFSELFSEALPSVTYEGDNYVLMGQVARSIMKNMRLLRTDPATKMPPTLAYLQEAREASPKMSFQSAADWLEVENVIKVLGKRTAKRAADFADQLEAKKGRLTDLSWTAVPLARAQAQIIVTMWSFDSLRAYPEALPEKERSLVAQLLLLDALTSIQADLSPLLLGKTGTASAVLDTEAVGYLEEAIEQLCAELLPYSISLSDAFDFTDFALGSILGRYDGDVYNKMLHHVQNEAINGTKGDGQFVVAHYAETIGKIFGHSKL